MYLEHCVWKETEFLNDTSTSTLSSSQIRHQEQLERLVHTKDAEIKELKQQIRCIRRTYKYTYVTRPEKINHLVT